ncbi:hypothetical protein [Pelagibius sp. Alg239-R121]|uniref:hypothetical protein n=1 Tax=Pelagibius sp. Alg239-R121 TaxID=2993448 RepID=UPI0024A628F6|nr:hypothetical protein [Pelagibius sp. Alg239-R121]
MIQYLYRQLLRSALPLAFFLMGVSWGVNAAEIPQRQASYSADAVLQINQRRIASKVYHHEGRERREFQFGGMPQVLILQPELNRVVYLLPLISIGMELQLEEGESLPNLAHFASLKPKTLGRETVNGVAATKYDVERLKAKEPYTLTLWLTDDGIPVQAEASDTRGDYRLIQTNIRRGAQDTALFEVPDGVKLAPVDAATLRGLFGG